MKFYDNTRIKAYKLCPRFFYYRHVRHWDKPSVGSPLVFGTGWHAGMDEIWGNWHMMDKDHLVHEATAAWRLAMLDEDIPIDNPEYSLNDFRTEGTAREMFANYIQARRDFLDQVEVISCEQPFAVPIGPSADRFYVGRLDKKFRYKGRVYIAEHKTTSMYAKSGNFRSTWINSFSPNSQIDGYSFAGMLQHEDFKAVWVDAALTHKQVHDGFMFIPLERSKAAMELWLWETNRWINLIENDMNQLDWYVSGDPKEVSEASFLHCFPRSSPDSCIQYNRECIYKDLCISHPNPELIEGVPSEFVYRRWEPFDEFKLERIGIEK